MQISEEIIERIKSENDIVEIISEKVKLKKSGRNFSGLCPFHNEKSPSFSVSQDKQIYKCFGCGEAGNVISFVMKDRNMVFLDAVRLLADRANIRLENDKIGKDKNMQKKDLLYKSNIEAARFFFSNLMSNKEAKEYFINRGIKIEIIKKFGLGYANNSWNDLMNYLRKKGISDQILMDAGLISYNTEKTRKYDRFRGRVMFPVFDYRGKVIGFGGRVLDDAKPKYLNSPETLVFQKGTNLYGLNFALKDGVKDRSFVIVEGYMDLITLHQYGITNVVASLGTALTINQARLLKRYADKVVISYDADIAGQMATMRGLEILRTAGFDVRVLSIPEGKDPDEFVRSNGKDAFLKLINLAQPLIDYRLKKAEEGIDFRDSQSSIAYTKKVMEILSDLDPIEKDIYIKKASENAGIKEQVLYDALNKKINQNSNYDEMNNQEKIETKTYIEPGFLKASRALLKIMISYLEEIDYIEAKVKEEDFIWEEHKMIFKIIKDSKNENKNNTTTFIESKLKDANSIKEFIKIKEQNLYILDNIKILINDYIYEIQSYRLKQRMIEIKKELKLLESQNKVDESIKLAIELAKINEQLKVKNK